MSSRKRGAIISAGLLSLSIGLIIRRWAPAGNFADFATGFLLGVSIALLILGLARPSRSTTR